jgi:hypothetical protein
MSERLTTRLANGGVGYHSGEYFKVCYPWNEHCLTDIDRMAIRLCDLEDKIEQGKYATEPKNKRLKNGTGEQKMENKKLDEACIMPDYEKMCANYKEMCAKVECEAEYWRTQHSELMGEVLYLRGVKHTLEAITGRKIGDGKS